MGQPPGHNVFTEAGASCRITPGGLVTGVHVPRALHGQGHGRELLLKVLEIADAEGRELWLIAEPFEIPGDPGDGAGLRREALDAWYERLGFERAGIGGVRRRRPLVVDPA